MMRLLRIAVLGVLLLAVVNALPDRSKLYKRDMRVPSGVFISEQGDVAEELSDDDQNDVIVPLARMFGLSRFRAGNDDIGAIIDEEVKKFIPEVVPDKATDDCKNCVARQADKDVKFEFNRVRDSCKAAFTKKWKEYCDKLRNDPRAVVVDIVQRDAVNPVNIAYGTCQISGPCRGL